MNKQTAGALVALIILPMNLMAATSNQPPESLTVLMDAINQRLEIANEVALSKWHSGKPVQDSDRERQVIANAALQAGEHRLSREDIRHFFAAQIEAGKMVQYARLAQWHATGTAPAEPAQGLAKNLRGQMDASQPVLLASYAAFFNYRKDAACPTWVMTISERTTTDPIMKTALTRAVGELCITG